MLPVQDVLMSFPLSQQLLHVWCIPGPLLTEKHLRMLSQEMAEGVSFVLCTEEYNAASISQQFKHHSLEFVSGTEKSSIEERAQAGSNLVLIPIPAGKAVDQVAAQYAAMWEANRLVVWRDAGGIPSADPLLCAEAFTLSHLTYQEAADLAFLNAGILKPSTIQLLAERKILIEVRPIEGRGTEIGETRPSKPGYGTGVTAQTGLALIVVEGMGMAGVPGLTSRILHAVSQKNINLILLSQSSTEQSIGIVIDQASAKTACDAIQEEMVDELEDRSIKQIYAINKVGIVNVVDDAMRYRPGLTGRMFSTLGKSGINVLTLAEGASETNIAAAVSEEDLPRAVRSLHEAFAVGRNRAHLFLFGAGTVGRILLKLLEKQAPILQESLNINLQLVGLANSRRMVWDTEGIPYEDALERLQQTKQPVNTQAIMQHLFRCRLERLIVIDATASDEIALLYPDLLESQISVITPNKRANTQDMAFYSRLMHAARNHHVPYFYETTVGAGLPVISTLRDLIRAGDEIISIEGMFSGTMGYLFSKMKEGWSFSRAVLDAKEKGFTEPDPRDDLDGSDIARKALILARELGLNTEWEEISIQSLVPTELASLSLDAFLEGLEAADDPVTPLLKSATENGNSLLYIGTITKKRLEVKIKEIPPDSPFFTLKGTDNMISFRTRWYNEQPLVIRGPGAGPEVTATGILADVVKAAELVA